MSDKRFTLLKRINPSGWAAIAIIGWAAVFRLVLLIFHYPPATSNGDEGAFGIEALHIAFQGQHPIYLYGQNYMGVLESYIAALFFHIFGVSLFTLRLGLVIMYILFLIVMYWLTCFLYTKRFAILSLFILSLATKDMLNQQLRTLGGVMETILFGSLLFLIAFWLASTSKSARVLRSWRYVSYSVWGFTVAIALWVDLLVLPFVLCSGLVLLVFCYREGRSPALLFLLLGFILGSYPLLHGLEAFKAVLAVHGELVGRGANLAAVLWKNVLGTMLWSLPLATGMQPICSRTDMLSYGYFDHLMLPCTILQGSWSVGYLILLCTAGAIAAGTAWKLWRGRDHLSEVEHQKMVRHFIRLMLVSVAALTIILYLSSPVSGSKPWSTRYLTGLLAITPAILWPLWQRTNFEHFRLVPLNFRLVSRIVMIMISLVILIGTIFVTTSLPAAYQENAQYDHLIQNLLKHKFTKIYVEYTICYPLMFLSQEQILCARPNYPPTRFPDRYLPIVKIVRRDRTAPYLFPANTKEAALFAKRAASLHKHYHHYKFDGMVIYVPSSTAKLHH